MLTMLEGWKANYCEPHGVLCTIEKNRIEGGRKSTTVQKADRPDGSNEKRRLSGFYVPWKPSALMAERIRAVAMI